MPKISILILHYKVGKLLIECLESIYKNPPKESFEIIVINNDESSLTEVLSKFPKVQLIQNAKNIGFGAGFNKGVEIAKGEYVLFLNPDAKVTKNSIDELYLFLSKHEDAGIASSLLVDEKGKVNPLCATQMLTPKRAFLLHSFLRRLFTKTKTVENFLIPVLSVPLKVDTVQIASCMMKKKVFNDLGKFDERYFLFFEEYDLAQRLQKQKLGSYIIPSSVVVHVGGQSMKQNKKAKKYFEESRRYYFKKYYGYISSSILSFFLGVSFWSIYIVFILALATFLSFYKLPSLMIFTSNQGKDFLLARDMVLSGNLTFSSLQAYALLLLFKLGGFNPLVSGYFTAACYVASVYLLYIVGKALGSKPCAVVASFLFATFPLVVVSARTPDFFNLVQILSFIFFLFCGVVVVKVLTNWKKGIAMAILILGIGFFNCVSLLNNNFWVGKPHGLGVSFATRMEVSNIIVSVAQGKKYNIKGENVDNFKYLTWYLGNGPSNAPQSLQFIISETSTGVSLDIRGEKK